MSLFIGYSRSDAGDTKGGDNGITHHGAGGMEQTRSTKKQKAIIADGLLS
ncbi:hypothetical protein [Aeromonas enteropelogenes]